MHGAMDVNLRFRLSIQDDDLEVEERVGDTTEYWPHDLDVHLVWKGHAVPEVC